MGSVSNEAYIAKKKTLGAAANNANDVLVLLWNEADMKYVHPSPRCTLNFIQKGVYQC